MVVTRFGIDYRVIPAFPKYAVSPWGEVVRIYPSGHGNKPRLKTVGKTWPGRARPNRVILPKKGKKVSVNIPGLLAELWPGGPPKQLSVASCELPAASYDPRELWDQP